MRPEFIRSPNAFRQRIKVGVTAETEVLDFKEALDGWAVPKKAPNYQDARREGQKELCRDIAQFANTWGGTLIIGVNEDKDNAPGIARSIVPLTNIKSMREWIVQAVTNYVVPSTLSYDVAEIDTGSGVILALNVPAHPDTVAIWDRHDNTIQYLRRQGNGKVYMNPIEAELHRMNTGRAARILMLDLFSGGRRDKVALADGLWARGGERFTRTSAGRLPGPIIISGLGEDVFNLRVPIPLPRPQNAERTIAIPYGLVELAWADAHDRMGLLLRARLVVENKELSLEPR